jgi:hypothetical protein
VAGVRLRLGVYLASRLLTKQAFSVKYKFVRISRVLSNKMVKVLGEIFSIRDRKIRTQGIPYFSQMIKHCFTN